MSQPTLYNHEFLRRKVKYLLDFMYGVPVGDVISSLPLRFKFSAKTGMLKALYQGDRLVAVRRKDGYLLLEKHGLGLLSNVKLSRAVVVQDVAKPFVANGKDVFAPHINRFIGDHYVGEDAIVISSKGEMLGCGQLLLLPSEVKSFKRGVAIKIRFGVGGGFFEAKQQ